MNPNHSIVLNEQEVMPVLRIAPADKGPLLLMVPSIFGIGPDVVEYAQTFARAGALVYVLDPFWREDPGPLSIPSGAPRAMNRMQQVDRNKVLTDLFCAIGVGRTDGLCNGSVLLLGICFGGQFVVKAAKGTTVQGVATWHGGNLLPVLDSVALKDVHLEMDFGNTDPLIPLSDVQKIQQLLRTHPNSRIRIHEKSGHGFTHTGTVKCNPMAAECAKNGVLHLIDIFRAHSE